MAARPRALVVDQSDSMIDRLSRSGSASEGVSDVRLVAADAPKRLHEIVSAHRVRT
jgi:hypothetical protein